MTNIITSSNNMPENRFDALFAEADAAFNGAYNVALKELTGLSREEVDAVTPGTADLRTYNVLMKVVEEASRDHLSQAQLVSNIRELGEVGVRIARKVPALAALI